VKTDATWINPPAAYIVSFFVLLGCIAILAWRVVGLRTDLMTDASGADASAVRALLSRPIPTSSGDRLTLSNLHTQFLVLMVFTPQDCAACLSELSSLDKISGQRQDVSVVGLMSYASPDEARQTQRNFSVSFPLLDDPDGKIYQTLHLFRTPWKVVVDVPHRRIVYQDPPDVTQAETQAFLDRISELRGR
jgi:peroxiredoxin